MTDTYLRLYEDVDAALREQLPPGAGSMLVDGDKAGYWLEAEYAGYVVTASECNGPWGVTLFSRDVQVALARNVSGFDPFGHEIDGLGGAAYWFDNREDGPAGDADPDLVAAYIVAALMGTQEG